jgi:glycosyltransferase involved in cell wall biosynthesis
VASSQAALLREHGVEVLDFPLGRSERTGVEAWSASSYTLVRKICERHRPDLAHVHNCWGQLSPSVHAACHDAGVSTVQSLYDFRLLCANGSFLRDNRPCEDCLGKAPWKGVARRCGGSFLASAAFARAIAINRKRGTWKRDVDAYIVSSEAHWEKFVYGGIPATRIFINPYFTTDPGEPPSPPSDSDLVLYLGPLAATQDVTLLLAAWKRAGLSHLGRLLIAGDGPERKKLQEAVSAHGLSPAAVMFAGEIDPVEVLRLIWSARAVVAPSAAGPLSGKLAVKALSCARPVLCPEPGDAAALVQDGASGMRFKAGDVDSLAGALEFLLSDDAIADCMGEVARAEFLTKYSPAGNYRALMRVYRFAIQRRGGGVPPELMEFEPAETVI